MALDVRYEDIRTQVIGKLEEQKEEMEETLGKLQTTVETIPDYMEGDATTAYINEFDTIVKEIYSKLNVNLGEFADQLENVCKEFEELDAEISTTLNGN